MKRTISMVLLGATLTMGAAACGSDTKDTKTTTPAAAVTTVAPVTTGAITATSVATTGPGTGSTNADVTAFCTSADALAAKVKAAVKDPSKLADLTKDTTDFVTKAAQLASANPSDVATIDGCAKRVADAAVPS